MLRRSAASNLHGSFGLSESDVGRVLRHVAPGKSVTANVYVQAAHERLLAALDAYAVAVLDGLPEHAEMPVEPEKVVEL